MTASKRIDLAARRAAGYAPMPADNGPMSGMIGAVLATITIVAVTRFYAIDITVHYAPAAAIVAVGFAIPFLRSIRRRRRHERATSVELRRIDQAGR